MRTGNASSAQDAILSACEAFGGMAAEAAEVAADLGDKLSGAVNEIKELNQRIEELEKEIAALNGE